MWQYKNQKPKNGNSIYRYIHSSFMHKHKVKVGWKTIPWCRILL